jgi:hypothetical protein
MLPQVGENTNLLDTTKDMHVCSWLPVGENTDRGQGNTLIGVQQNVFLIFF